MKSIRHGDAVAAPLGRKHAEAAGVSYAAYDAHPAEEPDEWGDLASWRLAAGAS